MHAEAMYGYNFKIYNFDASGGNAAAWAEAPIELAVKERQRDHLRIVTHIPRLTASAKGDSSGRMGANTCVGHAE